MTMDIPDPTTLSRAAVLELQSQKLRAMLAEIIPGNRFWTKKFEEAGVDPSTVQNAADLARLPLTNKNEIIMDQ